MTPPLRFTEADALDAADAWNFSCGPAAICALLALKPEEVRPHLGNFKGWMNPTQMKAALTSLRAAFVEHRIKQGAESILPTPAIWRVQYGGPWLNPGANAKAAYKFTHWVTAIGRDIPRIPGGMQVYDVNAMGWFPYAVWHKVTSEMALEDIPRADGRVLITHALVVS